MSRDRDRFFNLGAQAWAAGNYWLTSCPLLGLAGRGLEGRHVGSTHVGSTPEGNEE